MPMKVTRIQILARGISNRCPNCGQKTLFRKGSAFQMNEECPNCGMKIGRSNSEGFFLGSMSLNYGVTVVCFLLPVLLLAYNNVIGTTPAVVIAVIGAFGFPMLFYRSSRSWWLMQYYFFLPQHLPANRADLELVVGDDENI